MEARPIKIITTKQFEDWYRAIRDVRSRRKIALRIDRLKVGNFGDWKSVGKGVFELRIPFGSGFRVYFARKSNILVIILYGGDKSSQSQDIQKAQEIWREIEDGIS